MDRRAFVESILLATASVWLVEQRSLCNNAVIDTDGIILPPKLRKGDTVAFVAPASPSNAWEIHNMANFFIKRGCKVIYGETITKRDKRFRFLSNDDNFRAKELNSFFADNTINAIIAARGGYGSIRILNLIDYELISSNPKIFLGFSDVTVLLNAIYSKSKLVTFHGPTGNFPLDNFTKEILQNILFHNDDFEGVLSYKIPAKDFLVGGQSIGRLVGGNLTSLVSLLGTPYDFNTTGHIIFLEEISEHPYKVDRMLKQLQLAGKFADCKGLILGNFGKLDSRRNFYPDYSFTLREIFEKNFKDSNFPVVLNFPFGHSAKFFSFPLGLYAKIDATNNEFLLYLHWDVSKNENMLKK
ncbi:MAG: LD-carboxypeptidase [Ignavibacteria bacterium]|nr:LD-carboxypeptidase [Ignavibacteria bacterium]